MAKKCPGPSDTFEGRERSRRKPVHVYNGSTGKEEKLTLAEFRALPVEHLEPGYVYPYDTFETYDGQNDISIVRQAGSGAVIGVSTVIGVNECGNPTPKRSSTSTSKGKSQDKGKSAAK